MAKSKNNEYLCFYTMSTGATRSLTASLFGSNIAEATSNFFGFCDRVNKKPEEKIVSMTIMLKPRAGRKPRSSKSEAVESAK